MGESGEGWVFAWANLIGTEIGTESAKPGGEGGLRWQALGIPRNLANWTPFVIERHENKVVYSLPILAETTGLALEEGTGVYIYVCRESACM